MKTILLIFLACISITCCQSKLNDDNYIDYKDDSNNGLVKKMSQNGLTISCSYLPSDRIAIRQDNLADITTQSEVHTNEFADNIYCSLAFSINDREIEAGFLQSKQLHNACLDYLSNHVYKDVSIQTKQDTLPATASIYARQYGAMRVSSVLVVFSKAKVDLTHGFDIVYQGDKFGISPVRFSFTADAINKIPDLHY